MDKFVQPYVPGSNEAAHIFVLANKPAAAAAGRQRRSVAAAPATGASDNSTGKRSRGVNGLSSSNPKTISASSRCRTFPGEGLVVSAGALYCEPCAKRLGTCLSTIRAHCGLLKDGSHKAEPNQHMQKLEVHLAAEFEAPNRKTRFTQYCNKRRAVYGKTVDPEVNDKRCKLITQVMGAGISLSKLDPLRSMFTSLGADMVGSSKSKEYIGFINEEQIRSIRQDILGKDIGIAIDGTPFNGTETFGVVVRAVGKDLAVIKRLVSLRMLESAMNNRNIAAEVIDVVRDRLDISDRNLVKSFQFDGCAANRKAMRDVLPGFFSQAVYIACCSHLMDNSGKQIDAPRASDFMLKTSSVFSYSFHAKRELVNRAGKTWPRFVNHRWGSKAEVFEFLSTQLPAIEDFIRTFRNSDGRRNKTCQALQDKYLDNVHERRFLLLELAMYRDVLLTFKTACLALEGDDALVFKAYDIIQKVVTTLRLDDLNAYVSLPNVEALLRGNHEGTPDEATLASLRSHVTGCLKDIRSYSSSQFGDGMEVKFRRELDLFKAARIINHVHVRQQPLDDIDPEVLSIFPFISSGDITNLRAEMPEYMNAVTRQLSCLNDLVETTVMVRFNETDRTKGSAAQAAALDDEEEHEGGPAQAAALEDEDDEDEGDEDEDEEDTGSGQD
ncbi:conserved unknown protein [Ectocarpus siliculosus]|uniref:Uncharacterized protein n=1 Tax=Ectocarpus siliculosus TaxID=2880 RepID=D7G6I6_ECTSI|nr:conserved unknown protein [Ectocarpus siliculosus]|eukprot:CBJ27571.1 conserved unknown protein [Ectocarpus siliculosus]